MPTVPSCTDLFVTGFRIQTSKSGIYRKDLNRIVNGQPTFWDDRDEDLLFYCSSTAAWSLGSRDDYRAGRIGGDNCWSSAKTAGADSTNLLEADWTEWDGNEWQQDVTTTMFAACASGVCGKCCGFGTTAYTHDVFFPA